MLEALVIILVVLWALGFFAFHVGGGLIHALIVIALIILIVRLLKGRRDPLAGERRNELVKGPDRKTDRGDPRRPGADDFRAFFSSGLQVPESHA